MENSIRSKEVFFDRYDTDKTTFPVKSPGCMETKESAPESELGKDVIFLDFLSRFYDFLI